MNSKKATSPIKKKYRNQHKNNSETIKKKQTQGGKRKK
jgi:hypothetical protein